MKSVLLLIAATIFTRVVFADDIPFETYAGHALPNVELPAGISAKDGEVSLVADYKNAGEQGVPLYLINQTHRAISFPDQGDDLYIKLETQSKDGQWLRAQSHTYSFCGNSYGARVLQPGMHYHMLGYRPKTGEKGVIRFAIQSDQILVSNIGEGLFAPVDVENSAYDRMSLSGVPEQLIDGFGSNSRTEEWSSARLIICLELLRAYGIVPALKREAERLRNEWATAKIEAEAVKSFDAILGQPWPKERSTMRLLRQCLSNIEDKGASTDAQALRYEVSWRVVGELASIELSTDESRRVTTVSNAVITPEWQTLAKLAVAHLANAKREVAIGMNQLLQSSLLTDSTIRSEELENLLQGETYFTSKLAADALARRGRAERLAELGMNLSPEHQLTVFSALATGGDRLERIGLDGLGGVRGPASESKEEKFWRYVLKSQTERACEILHFIAPHDLGSNAFPSMVFQYLRAHWMDEVARSKASPVDFPLSAPSYSARLSVDFLSKAKRKDDIPLFRELLSYRGYEEQKTYKVGGTSTSERVVVFEHRYGVRYAALEALKALGEAVPQDIVIERNIIDPEHIVEKTNGMSASK
jgi:hypothetical protein